MRTLLAIAAAAALAGPAAHATPRPGALVLPQVAKEIVCDGELDELAWRTPARTGAFVDRAGEQVAPYSDARFLRDDHALYLALYAADEDIRSTDEFVVDLSSSRGSRRLHFSADGKAPLAGAKVAVDVDGTVDESSNDDEEWVIEAAIPLAAVPFGSDGSVTIKVSRCDVGKDHVTRCGTWQGRLVRR